MAKRQTIGENPLDGLFQESKMSNGVQVAVLKEEPKITQKKALSPKKQRITVQISEEVIDRIKNAVYWTPGLTLASLAENALSKAVDDLERQRDDVFPRRQEELKTGRPIK